LKVEIRDLPLVDPTDYVAILKGLRAHLQDICEAAPRAQLFVAVASGTPQMRLLSAVHVDRDPLGALPKPQKGCSLEAYLASARKQLILHALETAQGNRSEAARLLGITPQAVHKFVRKG
jgi:DNA-binding NtrC family response regulator